MSLKILSSFLLLFILSEYASALATVKSGLILRDVPECNKKRIDQMDQSVIRMIGVGRGGRKFPTTKEEAKTFCKETDRITSELEEFNKDCIVNEAQKISNIFLFSMKRAYKPICSKKKTKKQQKLLEASKCLNQFIEKIPCLEEFANRTRNIIPYDVSKDKIKYMCCYFADAIKCGQQIFDEHKCMTEDHKDTLLDLIRSISGDSINFGCGDYTEETDRCSTVKPPPKSKLDKNFKFEKFKSFFFVNIQVVDTMSYEDAAPL